MPNQTALIVDDEPHIRELVRLYLGRSGFHCVEAGDGAEALRMFAAQRPALVVLDLMLPGQSGWEVCQTIRAAHDTPVIMLTAKDDDADVIKGLEMGADDYVTKPFSPKELAARVWAILRRSQSTAVPVPARASFNGGRLVLDGPRQEATVAGQVVALTRTEWDLLALISRHPGRIWPRAELIGRLRGLDYLGDDRTIDAHIKKLRAKIEADPRRPEFILTAWGTGYRFGGIPDA